MNLLGGRPCSGLFAVALGAGLPLAVTCAPAAAPGAPRAAPAHATATPPSAAAPAAAPTAAMERNWVTADEARRIELRPGTAFVLAPHSRVVRLPMIPGALDDKDSASAAYSVELVSGRLDVDIDATVRPIYGLVVRAPRKVVAVVKAGKATVTAAPKTVTVAARSGRDLMVALGDRWRPLRVGKAFTASSTAPEGRWRDILASPALHASSSFTLALGPAPTEQRLSWSHVAGADAYLLRLYRDVERIPTLIREERVSEGQRELGALEAGHYFATVAAVDSLQLESETSQPVGFDVVEVRLPPGAEVAANTVLLPATERIRFSNSEKLELSYSRRENDFVPAPPSVGLNHGKSVVLRLRLAGSTEESQLTLLPIALVTTIEMGPARAFWPGPPVSVAVNVRHLDGRAVDLSQTVRATVTVDNEAVDVIWRYAPGRMTCSVEKPPTRGPWVVRLLLEDTQGQALGRSLLEVAPLPPTTTK